MKGSQRKILKSAAVVAGCASIAALAAAGAPLAAHWAAGAALCIFWAWVVESL